MNKLKAITDIYNDRQDEYQIHRKELHSFGYIKIRKVGMSWSSAEIIGFYEWLWNGKYKVFGTLKIDEFELMLVIDSSMLENETEEIIDYMYKAVKK